MRTPQPLHAGQVGLLTADPWQQLIKDLRGWVIERLQSPEQPGAGELLRAAEAQFGWEARHLLRKVACALRDDSGIPDYLRKYAKTVLTDEAIAQALRGGAKPNQEFRSTIDELFRRAVGYRNSTAYREAIEFAAKFRQYAPFNNLLVKIQKPSCCFFATVRDWQERFAREVKEDARPLLILAPMHPVMLVYDLCDTEGPDLPDSFRNFASTEGDWRPSLLERTLDNAERDHIQVQFKPLGSLHGGFATSQRRDGQYKMRVVVHQELDDKSRYALLCHELAHIYLGHLGADPDGWWPCRINLTHAAVEVEAESVAYIACTRMGLQPASPAYVATYLKDERMPDAVSLELITRVAGKLLEMGERRLPPRPAGGRARTKTASSRGPATR